MWLSCVLVSCVRSAPSSGWEGWSLGMISLHLAEGASKFIWWKSLSRVWLFGTPWTIVHGILQARILEWVPYPFSSGSSQPINWTRVSCTAGRFFTSWATREAQEFWNGYPIPSPADLPDQGIELESPALQVDFLLTKLPGKYIYQGRVFT